MPHKFNLYLFEYLSKILLLLTLFAINPKSIYAQNLPFVESFNGAFNNTWIEHLQNATLSFTDNTLTFTAYPDPQIFSYIEAGNFDWENYSLKVDIMGVNSVDKIILFRLNENGETYAINLRSYYPNDGNDILFQKVNLLTGQIIFEKHYSYNNVPNKWYQITIEINNIPENKALLNVYINDNYTNSHVINEYIENPIYAGKIGLGVWPQGPQTSKYDNLSVTGLYSSNILLNVPILYQFSSPWNINTYDHATAWSIEPYIENWGCALTSAAMVLRYYNHNVVPGSSSENYPSAINLNDWLISQKDGYIRNGLLNWLAISRFSNINNAKIDESKDLSKLEYERYSPVDSILDSKLADNNPPIVKIPGHFVILKGKKNSDYIVNDPGSETNTLFSEIEEIYGQYININQFSPSQTDLSYIMLVIDGDININVNGPSNGESFIETPLVNDKNFESTSGESLITYLIPKPSDGLYNINVSDGNGPFHIQIYRYDMEGNLINNKIINLFGNTKIGYSTSFQISYGKKNEIIMLMEILKNFWKEGQIRNNIYYSIKSKLRNAYKIRGYNLKASNNILSAFLNQIQAQKGKGIQEAAFDELTREVNYILSL